MKSGCYQILIFLCFSLCISASASASAPASEVENIESAERTKSAEKVKTTLLKEHKQVWKNQVFSKKGGHAYRILVDSQSWHDLFVKTLEEWGDLRKRPGVESGSIEVVESLPVEQEWDLLTIPMLLAENQRVNDLCLCVSFHITSKILYPQSFSYEKQSSYILKKYLHDKSDLAKGLFLPSKPLKKLLHECRTVFTSDIKQVNAQVETAFNRYKQREKERLAAELLEQQKIEQKSKRAQKKSVKRAVKENNTVKWYKKLPKNWLIYLFELVVFLLVVGVIMWPTIRREEKEAEAEKRERQREIKGAIRNRLMAKYNDIATVNRIVGNQYWQGQTKEQLIDSLGKPDDIDSYVMKSETKETWKYKQQSKKGFALLVFLDNGVVVGWETL